MARFSIPRFGALHGNFDRIQMASYRHSLWWKEESYNLLKGATTKGDFAQAVKWCGVLGGVTRTVSKKDFEAFAEYLFDQKNDIQKGNFDLDQTPIFSKKQPISWTSKICHILNPFAYPLAYDGNVKKTLQIKNIEQFLQINKDLAKLWKNKRNRKAAYRLDSTIWASVL